MNKLLKIGGVSITALSAALYASSVSKTVAEEVTQTSNLQDFTKIELNTSADMNIVVGDDFSIRMTGDDERMEKTVLEIKGKTLEIKEEDENRNRFNWDRDQEMKIEITMPDITAMKINGSGDVIISGVDNEELELKINGSGDMDVEGRSQQMDIGINGSGDIRMDEVSGKDVEVSINGSGDVEFNGGTCETMQIDINGSGDVEAKDLKCVDVNVDVSGSGDSVVYASNSIIFDSSGSGNVDVYGKPGTVVDKEQERRSRIKIR